MRNQKNRSQGVYFLSNNRMLDLTISFLNSFRKYNCDLPLCLIPFDEDYDQIEMLSDEYNFQVYSDKSILYQCDEISVNFHDYVHGAYRKLAIWEGPFDEFIYVDVDTVVLANIEFAFNFLGNYGCLTSHSDLPNLVQFVWKKSIIEKRILSFRQLSFSANTGFITSRRNFITLGSVFEKLEIAISLKEDMVLTCQEQPFLNYLIVTAAQPYSSLLKLLWEGHEDIMLEMWAGLANGKVNDGQMEHPDFKSIFLVHWAGLWQQNSLKEMPYYELWRYYRKMSQSFTGIGMKSL